MVSTRRRSTCITTRTWASAYPAHNIVILYWFAGGIFMVAGAAIMMGSSFSRLLTGRRTSQRDPMRDIILAGCVTVLFFSMQSPEIVDRWLWLPFMLALCFRPRAGGRTRSDVSGRHQAARRRWHRRAVRRPRAAPRRRGFAGCRGSGPWSSGWHGMNGPRQGRHGRSYVNARDTYRRAWRKWERKRPPSVELRDLAALMRAYSGDKGPEVLLIGDSHMFWAVRSEDDRRNVVDIIRDILGRRVGLLALARDGYNQAMEMAFLSALEHCRSRPKVVVLSLSVQQLHVSFRCHPLRGQAIAVEAVNEAVAAWPDGPKTIRQPTDEEWAASDATLIPSFMGQRRSMGELDLFVNARSWSKTQRTTRWRHLLDSYTGEALAPTTLDWPGSPRWGRWCGACSGPRSRTSRRATTSSASSCSARAPRRCSSAMPPSRPTPSCGGPVTRGASSTPCSSAPTTSLPTSST